MKTFLKIVGVLVLAFVLYISYMIAFPVSPKETVTYSSEISDFEVVYSRPFKKGRLVFGPEKDGALVPFRNYWRTGANKILQSLKSSNGFLHSQLANAFSMSDSPVWMDSSTKTECEMLEEAVGGAQALANITGKILESVFMSIFKNFSL